MNWHAARARLRAALTNAAPLNSPDYAQAAAEHMQLGLVVSRDLVTRQRAAFDSARAELGRLPRDVMESVESQFLFGVFTELVAEGPKLPTNGFARVVLHLAHYLTAERGLSLAEARDQALAVRDLYDHAEPLFEAIAERGRQAYRSGGDRHFVEIAKALCDATES